jgi:hypothetical protein
MNAMLKRAAEASNFLDQLSESATDVVTRLKALILSQNVLKALGEIERTMNLNRPERPQ